MDRDKNVNKNKIHATENRINRTTEGNEIITLLLKRTMHLERQESERNGDKYMIME